MAVARKPKPQNTISSAVDVDALINKGGSVAGSMTGSMTKSADRSQEEPVQVNLRIPPALLQRVDAALSARPIKTPRQTWILEAVLERLERETAG